MKIEAGEKPGTQKVLVMSSSEKLTKKQAVTSLGDKAKRYVVKTFAKKGEKEKAEKAS